MVQRGHRPRFLLEPATTLLVSSGTKQYLDCDVARQFWPSVARPIDRAHAALAKQRDDFVDAESRARSEGQVADYMGLLRRAGDSSCETAKRRSIRFSRGPAEPRSHRQPDRTGHSTA